jgi:hypothetical protein
MKNILIVLIFASLSIFAEDKTNSILTLCNSFANAINEQAPAKVDDITVLDSGVCDPRTPPALIYNFNIQLDSKGKDSVLVKKMAAENVKGQVNTWCANAEMGALLEDMVIQVDYRDINGVPLDSVVITSSTCN